MQDSTQSVSTKQVIHRHNAELINAELSSAERNIDNHQVTGKYNKTANSKMRQGMQHQQR